jgi:hypothetical protein
MGDSPPRANESYCKGEQHLCPRLHPALQNRDFPLLTMVPGSKEWAPFPLVLHQKTAERPRDRQEYYRVGPFSHKYFPRFQSQRRDPGFSSFTCSSGMEVKGYMIRTPGQALLRVDGDINLEALTASLMTRIQATLDQNGSEWPSFRSASHGARG